MARQLRAGQVDGFVGGLGRPYTATLRPALQLIGPAPGVRRVAGCIVAFLPERTVVFADTTGAWGYWMAGRVPLRRSGRASALTAARRTAPRSTLATVS